jgi:hypothetical protein
MEIGFLCDEQLHSYQAKVEAWEESKESTISLHHEGMSGADVNELESYQPPRV